MNFIYLWNQLINMYTASCHSILNNVWLLQIAKNIGLGGHRVHIAVRDKLTHYYYIGIECYKMGYNFPIKKLIKVKKM